MFAVVVEYMFGIFFGVVIVWSWVAFISEAIARRRGSSRAVPYPDEGLWALLGVALLGLGLLGGTPVWMPRIQRGVRRRPLGGHRSDSREAELGDRLLERPPSGVKA